jgi:hypothetical protein
MPFYVSISFSYLVTFLPTTANIDNEQHQEAQLTTTTTTTTTPILTDIDTVGQTIKVSVVSGCLRLSFIVNDNQK